MRRALSGFRNRCRGRDPDPARRTRWHQPWHQPWHWPWHQSWHRLWRWSWRRERNRRSHRILPGSRHHARPGPRRNDQGFAAVWVAVAVSALCVVFAGVLALGQAVAARHRAGGAADLAALAAADRALWGTTDACGAAARVAGAQGGEVVRCAVTGEIADVTVRARFGPYGPAVRSRAGPAAPPPYRLAERALGPGPPGAVR
ncbi:Rv3654c family TadE-like protein [Streptomyces sp. NPDC048696]|uniref:Rv3654c family TadE-like protein n=1 Tax=Streptomyces sp. NPDC048696 TaxID=3365585 RepID=UPI00371C2587